MLSLPIILLQRDGPYLRKVEECRTDGRYPMHQQKKEEARLKKEREQLKYQKEHAYDFLNNEDEMEATSNQNRDEGWEDDFM